MQQTVKLSNIFNAQREINSLTNLNLKASTAFKLSKCIKKLQEEIKDVEDKRIELVRKYKVSDPETRTEENVQKFNEEFNDLLNTEIELYIKPISAQDLVDSDNKEISIETSVLIKLDWLFKE